MLQLQDWYYISLYGIPVWVMGVSLDRNDQLEAACHHRYNIQISKLELPWMLWYNHHHTIQLILPSKHLCLKGGLEIN